MRPDILKYLGSLVASTMLLMMVVVLPATATDLAIGYLSSSCDGATASISWQITTDREGDSAGHPLIRVEWKPEGSGSWQTLGEGALNAGNSYVYAGTKSDVDLGGATRIDVKATAVSLAKGGAHWDDDRTAGDSYTSTLPVDPCQNNTDPSQFARVNWSAGCKTSPKQPTVMLFNDSTPDPDVPSPIEYDVIATMDGVTYTETVTVPAGMSEHVRLEFVKDGSVLSTEDRSISVLVNIGDRTEFKRTFKVDCVDDAVPTASAFGDCGSRGGMVVVDLANSAPTASTFVVTIDGETVKTATITDGAERFTFPVPEDGSYAVVITADGVEIYNDSVDVDCFDEPTPPTASFTQECVDADGTVVVTVVNDGPDPVDFVITIDGVEVDSATFADDTRSFTFNDIADGAHTITVTADGVEILSESFDVDCDVDTTPPTASFTQECANGVGMVAVTLVNDNLGPVEFEVSIDGTVVKTVTVTDGSEIVTVNDLADGAHTITVTADGVELLSESFDVDCDTTVPAEPSANVIGDCGDVDVEGGVITVTASNPSVTSASFTVLIDGVEVDSFDLADGNRVTTYDVAEGEHVVTVEADGEQVASENLDIECPPVSPPVVPTASFTQECVDADGTVVVTVVNDNPDPVEFVISIDGTEVKTVSITDDTRSFTFNDIADGAHTITVTADGLEILSESFDVDCDEVTTPPTASFTQECINGDGVVSGLLVNDNVHPVEFVVSIDGVVVRTVTITDGVRTFTVDDLADGAHTITVTADGVELLSESFDVDCDTTVPAEPSANVIGDCGDVNVEGGVITVTASNPSVTSASFTVLIDGVEVDSFDLADGNRVTTYDVAEGEHVVTVEADGEQVASENLDIECPSISPPLAPTASVLGACDDTVANGSTLTFNLDNPTDEALTFVITVSEDIAGVITESVVVPAGSVSDFEIDVAAGIYEVSVEADGLTLLDQTVNVEDCNDVKAATIETSCNTATGATTFVITNTQGADGSFVLRLNGVDYDLGLIAEGDSAPKTLTLANGDYAFELFRDGVLVDSGLIPVDCAGTSAPVVPAASIFGECDDSSSNGAGRITVDLDNPTDAAVTYVITATEDIAGDFTETVTVAANSTDSITLPVSAGIYAVDVTVNGDSIADEIVQLTECTPRQAFTIEVECATGGIATAKGTFQYTVAGDYVITVGSASDDLGTVAANESFAFSLPVTPGSQPYTLTRDGVEVESGTLPIPNCIPNTGLATNLLVPSALALMMLGFGMVAIARRRDAI